MKKKYMVLGLLVAMFSNLAFGNAPRYAGAWQWNDKVKLDFIYGYESARDVGHFRMDNGEYCYFNADEHNLLSMLLSIRATDATVNIVCRATPDKIVDGKDSRRVHRIRY